MKAAKKEEMAVEDYFRLEKSSEIKHELKQKE